MLGKMTNFFRDVYNAAKGRGEIVDRELNVGDNLGDLRDLLMSTFTTEEKRKRGISEPSVKIVYTSDGEVWVRESVPVFILELLEKKFRPEDGTYVTARDRSYLGEKDEMHYITIEKGIVEGKIGQEPLKRKPNRTAKLEILVTKENPQKTLTEVYAYA